MNVKKKELIKDKKEFFIPGMCIALFKEKFWFSYVLLLQPFQNLHVSIWALTPGRA